MSTTPQILKRLSAIDPASAAVDRPRAERAVAEHLERLGLPRRPLRWAADGPSGFYEILSEAWERMQRSTQVERIWSRLMDRIGKRVGEARDPAYVGQLGRLLTGSDGSPSKKTSKEILAIDDWYALAMAAEDAAERILREAGIVQGSAPFVRASQAMSVVGATVEPNPGKLARAYLAKPSGRKALEPLIDALEAGLWLFWPGPAETLLIPRPARRFRGCALHDEHGPAVSWPGGASYWALFGQRVDRAVVEAPATLDPVLVEREPSAYRRGIMIERYGRDRYLSDLHGSVVAETSAGRLLRFQPPGREAFSLVETPRRAPELPASYVRVPEAVATPEEGLAWTFGLTPEEVSERVPLYASEEIGPQARDIIDRLRRLHRTRPLFDREKAEAALSRLFPSLARGRTRVTWIRDRVPHAMEFCKGHELGEDSFEGPEPDTFGVTAFSSAVAACRLETDREALRALRAAHPQVEVALEACTAAAVAMLRHQGEIALEEELFQSRWMSWVELHEAGAVVLWTSPEQILALPRTKLRPTETRRREKGARGK